MIRPVDIGEKNQKKIRNKILRQNNRVKQYLIELVNQRSLFQKNHEKEIGHPLRKSLLWPYKHLYEGK